MKILFQLLAAICFALPSWSQDKGWEKQWKETIEAAQKEGKVVVMGSADPVLRQELPTAFKAKFGIALEYIGGRGGDNSARVRMERRAGVYTVDAVFAGLTNIGGEFYAEKMLDPLRPALILPEVVDPSKWKNGKLWFLDPEEKFILRLYRYISSAVLSINTQHVKAQEIRSIKDLLHPKWKGKISAYDPTVSGAGSLDAARYYRQLGEEFVRKLYIDQKPVLGRDKRQFSDWLARGTYPVSLAAETESVINMKAQGFPVEVISTPDMPGTLGAGNGLVGLMNQAPHPNAARVFVNWIASKEGVEILGRARQKPTTRNDIDESYAVPWEIPQPGINYFDSIEWEFNLKEVPKVRDRMKELLKAR